MYEIYQNFSAILRKQPTKKSEKVLQGQLTKAAIWMANKEAPETWLTVGPVGFGTVVWGHCHLYIDILSITKSFCVLNSKLSN